MTETSTVPRTGPSLSPGAPPSRRRGLRGPTFTQVVLGVPIIFMTVMYAYPVAGVLLRSITDPEMGFGNFVSATQDPVVLKVLWITVGIAAKVALITVILGFPVAFMSVQPRRRARMLAL